MALPAFSSGDIVKFTVVCQDTEQVSLNNFYYLAGIGTGGSGDPNSSAVAFDAMIAPLIKPILNNNSTYNGVICQRVFPTPVPARAVATANKGSGTGGAISLPRQTAGITSWTTDLAKQANRGRTYWPFPPAALSITDGKPNATYVGALITMATAIRTLAVLVGPTGGDFCVCTYSIYHRKTNTTQPITGSFSQFAWATQKRRGTKGKANTSPV
jgi:hypothetical protein